MQDNAPDHFIGQQNGAGKSIAGNSENKSDQQIHQTNQHQHRLHRKIDLPEQGKNHRHNKDRKGDVAE